MGWSADPKRRYVSWVKNDVNQFGLYLFLNLNQYQSVFLCSVRKEQQQIAKAEFYSVLQYTAITVSA